jgi:hypothetical protein
MESPETLRGLEVIGDLNISLCSMAEERTQEEEHEEEEEPEPVYRPPPTPPPWSHHFSNHSWNSRVFWAPNGTRLSAQCHFTGSKNLSNSRAQSPPTSPRNGYAHIQNIMHGAV